MKIDRLSNNDRDSFVESFLYVIARVWCSIIDGIDRVLSLMFDEVNGMSIVM